MTWEEYFKEKGIAITDEMTDKAGQPTEITNATNQDQNTYATGTEMVQGMKELSEELKKLREANRELALTGAASKLQTTEEVIRDAFSMKEDK